MSTETPTPETAKAILAYRQWQVRNLAATMLGSHLDRDDPQPPDGWEIARRLERERDLAIKDRDEAVQLFTQELNKAVERIKSHGTSPKSRT